MREASRVKKRYDKPKTRYRRLLENPEVGELTKRGFRGRYAKLNPAQLVREINSSQRKLCKTVASGTVNQREEAEQEAVSFK